MSLPSVITLLWKVGQFERNLIFKGLVWVNVYSVICHNFSDKTVFCMESHPHKIYDHRKSVNGRFFAPRDIWKISARDLTRYRSSRPPMVNVAIWPVLFDAYFVYHKEKSERPRKNGGANRVRRRQRLLDWWLRAAGRILNETRIRRGFGNLKFWL